MCYGKLPGIVNKHFTKLLMFTNNECKTHMPLGIYTIYNYYNGLKVRIWLEWVENIIAQFIFVGWKLGRLVNQQLKLLNKHSIRC